MRPRAAVTTDPVVTFSEPQSMSRETTFERDLHAVRDRAQLTRIFTELCIELSDDLQRKRYSSRTIGIKLRFENFKTVTRDNTLASSDRRRRSDPARRRRMSEASRLDEADSFARRACGILTPTS